jgi:hypothetical protein
MINTRPRSPHVKAAGATNFRTIVHPSLPNYVAATSGGTQGTTDDAARHLTRFGCSRSSESWMPPARVGGPIRRA